MTASLRKRPAALSDTAPSNAEIPNAPHDVAGASNANTIATTVVDAAPPNLA